METLLQNFQDIKGYFTGDKKLLHFIDGEPTNADMETIFMKMAGVGIQDLWQSGDPNEIAAKILSLNIDKQLITGDHLLVCEIADNVLIQDHMSLYHMASKYCCLHKLMLFPIYSTAARCIMNAYAINSNSGEIKNYIDFCFLMERFVKEFKMNCLNYFETDKFLWLYKSQLLSSLRIQPNPNPLATNLTRWSKSLAFNRANHEHKM